MFVIDDINELRALLKTLWTIKFDCSAEDGLIIAGSPFVAAIYKRAYEALISALEKTGFHGEAFVLKSDLTANHSFELLAIEKYIQLTSDYWKTLTTEQKIEYINILIAPFLLNSTQIEGLLEKY